tara:strand:- start:124 stop:552 length:429 start_codon:yes stop_codon:yes gene_type:complete
MEQLLLTSLEILPMDTVNIIEGFVPIEELYLTCKKSWKDYNDFKINTKSKYLTRSYLVKIIRNDFHYIFNIVLHKKFIDWFKAWKFRYEEITFPCFIEFLNYLCLKYKSRNCRKVISDHKIKNGFEKKKYKRIRIKNSKWSN